MRKIIRFAIAACFFLLSFTKSSSATSYASSNAIADSIVQQQKNIVTVNSPQQKMNLKERLILKWYKKKNSRIISEEEEKKKIELLGKISMWFAIAAIVLVIVPMGFFLSALLLPASFILGIMSLKRRNKSENKEEINKRPALIGVILSSLAIVFVLISVIYFAFFY